MIIQPLWGIGDVELIHKPVDGYTIGEYQTKRDDRRVTPSKGTLHVATTSVQAVFRAVEKHFNVPLHARSSSEGQDYLRTYPSFEFAWEMYTKTPYLIRERNDFTASDLIYTHDNVGSSVEMDVTGDYLDIGTALEGTPECFGQMLMGKAKGFATLLLNLSASSFVSTDTKTQYARRVVRLVDWLEFNSVRTQIIAFMTNQCTDFECTVKRYEDHLNWDDLAIITDNDFFRRIVFRLIEHSKTYQGGYGNPTEAAKELHYQCLRSEFANELVVVAECADNEKKVDAHYDRIERDLRECAEQNNWRGFIC